jgi:hypothetical protein
MSLTMAIARKRAAGLAPPTAALLQRKCTCSGAATAGEESHACRRRLQRQYARVLTPPSVPPIVYEVLRSPGQPLDPATRAFMEPRFGHDFGQVRVHTDERAAQSFKGCGALAYTVGEEIVFAPRRYAPDTAEGKRLLAHELAHVVSQGSEMDGSSEMALERSADAQASQVLSGLPESRVFQIQATPGNPRLQRKADAGASPTVYMCAEDLETSPIGRHAFFRTGSEQRGNPTYEEEASVKGLLPQREEIGDWR